MPSMTPTLIRSQHRLPTPQLQDDACGLCGYWTCRCHELRVVIPHRAAARPHRLNPSNSGGQQCESCGGVFGVTSWLCGACQALGLRVAPAVRPVASTDSDPDTDEALRRVKAGR